METGKSVLQLHISFKYRWSIGVLLEMTALAFLDQSKTSIMGFIFSFLNVSDSFIWRKHIFLDQNNKFLLWLTSSSNKHTVASNMFFSSSQTETISLSVQSLLTVCNHQTLTFSIFFFYQSKKKEEKCSMLFFFWQKKKHLYLNSVLLCTPVSPRWHGEPSAGTNCTTAQGTWSRTSWSHLSRSCPRILWSRSDAGWPTRTVSVSKALRDGWKQLKPHTVSECNTTVVTTNCADYK